jgi:dienelactone hydrolase
VTRNRRRIATIKTAPPLRVALVLFALLAFAFQSYVTQTHIHVGGQSFGALVQLAATDGAKSTASKDKYPANQDPSNCPICQEMVHSGSFITPSAIAALPPALAVSIVALRLEAAIAPQATSHSWRGRAPPHA